MDILNCIVHQVISEQGNRAVELNKRRAELAVNDDLSKLIGDILKSYEKDGNPAYGDFHEGHAFPVALRAFLDRERNFVRFSDDAVEALAVEMRKKVLANGGYLLIAHYRNAAGRVFVIVVMLKESSGFAFDTDLELQDVEQIDLGKLHFAARINVGSWVAKQAGAAQNRYISFLKGASREVVTEYFKQFLGIDDSTYVDPVQNVRDLKKAIKQYAKNAKWDAAREHDARAAVRDYGLRQLDEGKPVSLDAIANLIEPGEPQAFLTFAQKDDVKLQLGSQLNRSELQRFTQLKGQNKWMTIRLEEEALQGKNPKAQWKNGVLTIYEVPDSLKAALNAHTAN